MEPEDVVRMLRYLSKDLTETKTVNDAIDCVRQMAKELERYRKRDDAREAHRRSIT